MNERKTQVISIVGAGGKTSLLYTLAGMFLRGDGNLRLFGFEPVQRAAGNPGNSESPGSLETQGIPRVLVTTTTKILQPEHCGWCGDLSAIRDAWEAGQYAVAGTPYEEPTVKNPEKTPEKTTVKTPEKPTVKNPVKKLRALPEEVFLKALDEADVVLIEADGAKHLPLKLPAAHEPMIRPETTHVLGVAGLSCLGRPVSEVCFRWELLPEFPEFPECLELLKRSVFPEAVPDRVVTEELVATILASEHGTRKNVGERPYLAVLNQCTTPDRKAAGEKILRLLQEKYHVNGVLTALSAP